MKLTLTAEQRIQQCLTADYLASDHYGLIPCAVLRGLARSADKAGDAATHAEGAGGDAMKLASIKMPVTLNATDEEIAVLVMTARRGGTEAAFYADLLDNMVACVWASNRQEAYDRAEDCVTAAMKLRDYADVALSDERSPWGDQK